MIPTVYCPLHEGHAPEKEFFRGRLVPCFERPERALRVLAELRARGLGEIVELRPPADAGGRKYTPDLLSDDLLRHVAKAHSVEYVGFVASIFAEFQSELRSAGGPEQSYALPYVIDRLGRNEDRLRRIVPATASGRLGYYSFDTGTPFTAGTWSAALGAAGCAVRAQEIAVSEGAAFALCRPPGHHAHREMCGGYCFLNNAAIAAEAFRDRNPAALIAVLDVDFHHGNGTQSIYYDRTDTLVTSIHGDPRTNYPYFLGHADEVGTGAAEGWNANFPLADGARWATYEPALARALGLIEARDPQFVIVSLGVDTFRGDRISTFRLESEHFLELGRHIASLRRKTLFVMEGGYHDEIGINVANVLEGFLSGR
jgi:acetoin utilization deacetylase AcuC-like enzyme